MLIKGDISGDEPCLVRMHALDPVLDVIGLGPRVGPAEFGDAMKLIADEGRGVLVLLRDTTMKLVTEDDAASPQTLASIRAWCANSVVAGACRTDLLTNSPKAEGRRSGGLWS